MKSTRKVNYINNKTFQEEMIKYHKSLTDAIEKNEPEPKANDYIGKAIYQIATKYANKSHFYGYTNLWKDEMIWDGIENCIRYGLKNYNPEKYNNPMAYFTEIIKWAFIGRIQREKKEQYAKLKCQQSNEMLETVTRNKFKNGDNDIADHLIMNFERKMSESKIKRNVKKGIELFTE